MATLLKSNTELTQAVHTLTQEIHQHLFGTADDAGGVDAAADPGRAEPV